MGSLHLAQFKKQASFFLREKLKTARLALTDVTQAELLTEEATNSDPWGPETRIMAVISQAAFEVDDYGRIVEILHKRLSAFDTKPWRSTSKTLVLLEYLLTHGPESVAADFRTDKDALHQLTQFQYVDDLGFDWGQSIQKKAERILELLNQEKLLKEERIRARRVSIGIRGSGSFSSRTSSLGEFTSSNSALKHVGEEVDTSYEQEINQTIEKKNNKHEDGMKIHPKRIYSLGIDSNFHMKEQQLCNGKEHRDDPTTDKEGKTESKYNSYEYPSNREWQPFEQSSMSTDKTPSSRHSSSNGDKNLISNDQHTGKTSVQDHSNSSNINASDGLHEDDYRPETEGDPLLKCSTDGLNTSQTASIACNEIHPFGDIENDPTGIHPFGDIENDTTECFLSQRHKKSPVSILDFPHSARRAINI